MRKLLKSFKTEINPTAEQKIKINKTIGTCRYVYNFYLGYNKALYDKGEKFMTGKIFQTPKCFSELQKERQVRRKDVFR